jgi:hypothetical protein
VNAPVDHSRLPEPWAEEEPVQQIPRLLFALCWIGIALIGIASIYGIYHCLSMAWSAIP